MENQQNKENDTVESCQADTAIGHNSSAQDTANMMNAVLNSRDDQAENFRCDEESENLPRVLNIEKQTENLEDLSRLAMFGKTRAVLRRSQINAETSRDNGVICHLFFFYLKKSMSLSTTLRSEYPSKQNGSLQRKTSRDVVATDSASRSVLRKNVQRHVTSTDSEKGETSGPITRSRYRELHVKSNAEEIPTAECGAGYQKDLRGDFNKMGLSSQRSSRDRTPRSNVSSVAVTKQARRIGPVRVGHPERSDIGEDPFLRNEVLSSEGGFRRDMVHRNANPGIGNSGSSSKSNRINQTPQSSGSTKIIGSSNASSKGPNTLQTRGSSLTSSKKSLIPKCRASSVTRVCGASPKSVQHPVRSSSLTRPFTRPLEYTGSAVRRFNTERTGNDFNNIARPTARPQSVTRHTVRPPSIDRHPTATNSSDRRPITAHTGGNTRQLESCGSASRQQKSDRNKCDIRPRSSVIHRTPVKRGGGDGTPLRGFRAELRRYPIPTGATPCHRPVTVTNDFHLVPKHIKNADLSQIGSTTSTTCSPGRVLSKEEVQAMVNRLAIPKRVANSVTKTTTKITNQQTHGLSCVKIRSRSTSSSRPPISTACHSGTVSRALLFSRNENTHRAKWNAPGQVESHITGTEV
ncbi:hypothetical protein DICVIV_02316 [Dictyocaulus viviparus]|uniref:Uncharacterized protein n=1 Tax=Dictyocaulus viviparus TaxID=29172 RepID=A0A0D8Y3N4_DICVI|nr:hypothetical protein DICVIV_02316 [Dictyocaulus viviparus]